MFQEKKYESFDTNTHTHTHTHTHTRTHTDTSPDYGAHPPLFIFEFYSHQSLLCLLCYVLLVHLL